MKSFIALLLGIGLQASALEGPALDAKGNLYVAQFEKPGHIGFLEFGKTEMRFLLELPDGGASAALRFDPKGNLLIADYKKHRIHLYHPRTKKLEIYVEETKMNQPNDLAVAKDGTLYLSDPSWSSKKSGQIWKVSPNRSMSLLRKNLKAVNGIDLSPDESKLYFTESISGELRELDLKNPKKSVIKTLHRFEPDTVDGIRTDILGNIYVTRIKKGTIDQVSPEGKLLLQIPLSGKEPTNLSFGGSDGKSAVVTLRDRKQIEKFRFDQAGRDSQFLK